MGDVKFLVTYRMKLFKLLLGIVLCYNLSGNLLAQSKLVPNNLRSIQLTLENDFFFFTDKYYTNGVALSYIDPVFKHSPLIYPLSPFVRDNNQIVSGILFRQNMYTPDDTHLDIDRSGDRPYASTLTISQIAYSFIPERKLRFRTAFTTGLVGQYALGGITQGLVHKITPSHPPLGWENQIRNDFLMNYFFEVDKGLWTSSLMDVILHGETAVGTWQDNVGVGARIRFGHRSPYFSQIAPLGASPRRGFDFYLTFGADVKAVFYDATMQGGLVFNYEESPHVIERVEVEPIVQQYYSEMGLSFRRHQIVGKVVLLSPEFIGSGWHRFGSVSYKLWF
ncbi:hypothetical protein PEDI_18560 [Persicobacter diffluens]|uniref:Lipid A deacylase LpxR family protein n=2 Tax=Persicobacter diffluens TaxID=981 RepID=A0AAN4VWC3_9BACT|nr:hypothetical protein PEDI_18560 [Persicobacter diffluens]